MQRLISPREIIKEINGPNRDDFGEIDLALITTNSEHRTLGDDWDSDSDNETRRKKIDVDIRALAVAIERNPYSILKVNFSEHCSKATKWSIDSLKIMGNALKNQRLLSSIDIHLHESPSEEKGSRWAFLNSLLSGELEKLETLCLHIPHITHHTDLSEILHKIGRYLFRLKSPLLKKIIIRGNLSSDELQHYLPQDLQTNCTANNLLSVFVAGINVHKNLKTLELKSLPLGDFGIKYIFNNIFFKEKPKLTKISLISCGISNANQLLAFTKTTSIEIDLSDNPIPTLESEVKSANSSSFVRENITNALIDVTKAESPNDYQRQKKALTYVFDAFESKSILSVDFIRHLHKLLVPVIRENPNDEIDTPGEFRNVGMQGGLLPDERGTPTFSIEGITEIFSIFEEEAKSFNPLDGTAFKSLCNTPHIDCSNFKILQGNKTTEQFIGEIQEDLSDDEYRFSYPSKDQTSLNIKSYMEKRIGELIDLLNAALSKTINNDDKIRIIFAFIQSCERLHPFRAYNHRVFVLCVLNFLLLSHGIGYCPLKNRRIFRTLGINEVLKKINKSIVLIENNSLEEPEFQQTSLPEPFEEKKPEKLSAFSGRFFKATGAATSGAIIGGGLAYYHVIASSVLVGSGAGAAVSLLLFLLAASYHHYRNSSSAASDEHNQHFIPRLER